MMRETINNNKRIFAFTAAVVAAFIAVVIAALSFAYKAAEKPTVHAETGGSITIHVYDTKQEYSKIGGWFWIKAVDWSSPQKMGAPLSDEQFQKDGNVAHAVQLTLTDGQVTRLKAGTYLGLLILQLKPKDFDEI